MFKIKDGYKLELKMTEAMKLFGSTNKLLDKLKNGEKVPSLEAVEVVLVQYTFTPNKSQLYLLNVEQI